MLRIMARLIAWAGSSHACATSNSITGFTLIDADLDVEIGPLPSSVIDYSTLPTTHLNVRADYQSCESDPIDSVYMEYHGSNITKMRCDPWTPYAVFGDNNPDGPDLGLLGDFYYVTFPLADGQTITATPNTGAKCNVTTQGTASTVTFNVENTVSCPGKVMSFVLWDADSDEPERQINDGDTFCPQTGNYNIEARVLDCTDGTVASVDFYLSQTEGGANIARAENNKKYFLLGNNRSEIHGGGVLADDRYTLSATPYEKKGANGDQGIPLSITFDIDCTKSISLPSPRPTQPPEVQNQELTCIAILDENTDQQYPPDVDDLWTQLRQTYPQRPFCLLQPTQFSNGSVINYVEDLYQPEALQSDPNHIFQQVHRDEGDASFASDWYSICKLKRSKKKGLTRVAVYIDNSGSMTTGTVQASIDLFHTKIAEAGIVRIGQDVENDYEDYIEPCLLSVIR